MEAGQTVVSAGMLVVAMLLRAQHASTGLQRRLVLFMTSVALFQARLPAK